MYRKRKISILVALSMAALFYMTGCTGKNAGSAGSSVKKDVFRVGMECDYPPFNWTQLNSSGGGVKIDGNAEYAGGYDVEIAKRIAKGLGRKLVIVKTKWEGLEPALNSGKIDAIVAGMSPTAKRKKNIDFTDNYYHSDLVMVVKKGSSYENATSIQDFKGAKITAQLSTFHYSVIDQIKGAQKQTAMEKFTTMRVALESGIVDGYVSERPEGISAQSADPNLKMVEFKDGFVTSEDDTAIAAGLVKNSPLKKEIDEILKNLSEDKRVEIMDDAIKNQPSAR